MTNEIDDAVCHLAAVLGRKPDEGGLAPGDRAELRHMDPLGPALPGAAWRLLTAGKVAAGIAAIGGDIDRAERATAILIQAMLETGTDGATPIGKALADSNYAEQRFVRLLRARGLADVALETRCAARWCGGKGVRVRFGRGDGSPGCARFVLDAALDRAAAERQAHTMARDYFRAINRPNDAET